MLRSVVAAGIGTFCVSQAMAGDLPMPAEQVFAPPVLVGSQWSFAVAPYGWAAGISGNVAQFGAPAVEVDASFSDILKNLDFGAMAVTELRYGRFGLFSDFMYVKISGAAGTPRGVLAETVSLDTKSLTFTAAPEYRVLENARGSLDVMAGLRVWSVDTDLAFSGGLLAGVSANDGDTWVDPMVGAKGRFNVTDRLYLTGWAMVGGFGVSSDLMWDALGGIGYEFNNTFSTVIGYRGTGVDYRNDDGFVYDVIQQGPVIGGVLRF